MPPASECNSALPFPSTAPSPSSEPTTNMPGCRPRCGHSPTWPPARRTPPQSGAPPARQVNSELSSTYPPMPNSMGPFSFSKQSANGGYPCPTPRTAPSCDPCTSPPIAWDAPTTTRTLRATPPDIPSSTSLDQGGDLRGLVVHYHYESGPSRLSRLCSGALIAQKGQSRQRKILITARHCVSTRAEADSMETVHYYLNSSCRSTSLDSRRFFTSEGATYLDGLHSADQTLVELRGRFSGHVFPFRVEYRLESQCSGYHGVRSSPSKRPTAWPSLKVTQQPAHRFM